MEKLVEKFEQTIEAISSNELKKNPKASAKAFEIKQMIDELKKYVNMHSDSTNQGVLQYINRKVLLEN